jgi:acyl carrier protein
MSQTDDRQIHRRIDDRQIDDRLIRCFAAVFPELAPDEIQVASSDTLQSWNSLSAVTLIAVIEQEFGIKVQALDLPELDSFHAVRGYVSDKLNVI